MKAIKIYFQLLLLTFTTPCVAMGTTKHDIIETDTLQQQTPYTPHTFSPQDSLTSHRQDTSTTLPHLPVGSRLLSQDTFPAFSYENVKNYIFSNLHYPPKALEKGIEGVVLIHFRIRTDGKIDDLKITKNVHPILDSTAFQLIRQMPRWEPIMRQGKPESISYTVPVSFKIPQ